VKNGFSMIELIFVIVIIGILASVAVPKLAATRDDAKRSGLIANTKICIEDLISAYKGQGVKAEIDKNDACVTARTMGASISYSGDFVHVEDTNGVLDGNFIFKGVLVKLD